MAKSRNGSMTLLVGVITLVLGLVGWVLFLNRSRRSQNVMTTSQPLMPVIPVREPTQNELTEVAPKVKKLTKLEKDQKSIIPLANKSEVIRKIIERTGAKVAPTGIEFDPKIPKKVAAILPNLPSKLRNKVLERIKKKVVSSETSGKTDIDPSVNGFNGATTVKKKISLENFAPDLKPNPEPTRNPIPFITTSSDVLGGSVQTGDGQLFKQPIPVKV